MCVAAAAAARTIGAPSPLSDAAQADLVTNLPGWQPQDYKIFAGCA
jgi:hypothetical protein